MLVFSSSFWYSSFLASEIKKTQHSFSHLLFLHPPGQILILCLRKFQGIQLLLKVTYQACLHHFGLISPEDNRWILSTVANGGRVSFKDFRELAMAFW